MRTAIQFRKIHKIIILPAVLCGYETWSLVLRKERTLRVSEKRVLRRIFGPKREEMAGDRRRLHNMELHKLHFHYMLLGW
jgi:hypothetical protein